jgi:hypothetical protein
VTLRHRSRLWGPRPFHPATCFHREPARTRRVGQQRPGSGVRMLASTWLPPQPGSGQTSKHRQSRFTTSQFVAVLRAFSWVRLVGWVQRPCRGGLNGGPRRKVVGVWNASEPSADPPGYGVHFRAARIAPGNGPSGRCARAGLDSVTRWVIAPPLRFLTEPVLTTSGRFAPPAEYPLDPPYKHFGRSQRLTG